MTVCVAIVFLFNGFKCGYTLSGCWLTLGFLLLGLLLACLEKALHFFLNFRIDFDSLGNVHLLRLFFLHSRITVPRIPLTLPNKIKHRRFWSVAVSNSCLFVQTVNNQLILVHNCFGRLPDVFGRSFKYFVQDLFRDLIFGLFLIYFFTLHIGLLFSCTEKNFLEKVHWRFLNLTILIIIKEYITSMKAKEIMLVIHLNLSQIQ